MLPWLVTVRDMFGKAAVEACGTSGNDSKIPNMKTSKTSALFCDYMALPSLWIFWKYAATFWGYSKFVHLWNSSLDLWWKTRFLQKIYAVGLLKKNFFEFKPCSYKQFNVISTFTFFLTLVHIFSWKILFKCKRDSSALALKCNFTFVLNLRCFA